MDESHHPSTLSTLPVGRSFWFPATACAGYASVRLREQWKRDRNRRRWCIWCKQWFCNRNCWEGNLQGKLNICRCWSPNERLQEVELTACLEIVQRIILGEAIFLWVVWHGGLTLSELVADYVTIFDILHARKGGRLRRVAQNSVPLDLDRCPGRPTLFWDWVGTFAERVLNVFH